MSRRIRVALYMRRSTGERTQRDSLKVQEELLRAYAAEHRMEVVARYMDSGSGTSLRHRPEFRKMIRAVERGCHFVVVLCRDVSRFGRFPDPDEAAYWQFHLGRHRVKVIYCEENLGSEGTPIEGFTLAVKRVMAGEFSRDKARVVSYGQERVARMGFHRGGPPPYGMQRWLFQDGSPVQQLARGDWKALSRARTTLRLGPPEEVAVVRRIFEEFAAGHTRQQIARDLNADGIPSPRGGRWYLGTVGVICTNPAYVGTSTFRRRSNPKRKAVIATPSSYEAVVTPALWDVVQQRIALETRNRSDEALAYDLSIEYLRDGFIHYRTPSSMPVPCSFETVRHRFPGGVADALHVAFAGELDEITQRVAAHLDGVRAERDIVVVAGLMRVAIRLGFTTTTRWGDASDFGGVSADADVMIGARLIANEVRSFVTLRKPRTGWPRRLRLRPRPSDTERLEEATKRLAAWVCTASEGAEAAFLQVVRAQHMVNLSAAARELGWQPHVVRSIYQRLKTRAFMPPLKYVRGRKLTVVCEVCGDRRQVAPNRAVALRSNRCRKCTRNRGTNKVKVTCPRCGRTTLRWPSAVARLAGGVRTPCRACG